MFLGTVITLLDGEEYEDSDEYFNQANVTISESYENDIGVGALNNVMMHLEEKQKKRKHEKMSEEFADIKSRLGKILTEFGISEESEDEDKKHDLDLRMLTDPNFMTEADEEKRNAKTVIDDILAFYSELCQEREEILINVQDSLDAEGETEENTGENLEKSISQATKQNSEYEELEDVSSEITMTIENINRKTRKLNILYNKLLQISMNLSANKSNVHIPQTFEQKAREISIQKQVIGQFKKLHLTKNVRKEKLDTWKFAANEIVDLLKSVRQEGVTDFERLEKEFKKLLDTFNAQGELLDDTQLKLKKHKELLQQSDKIKEKLRKDLHIVQEECERYRVQNRTAQMKINEKDTLLQEKENQLNAAKRQENLLRTSSNESDSLEVKVSTHVLSFSRDNNVNGKIKTLEAQVNKYEEVLKLEEQKRKILEDQIMRLQQQKENDQKHRSMDTSGEKQITKKSAPMTKNLDKNQQPPNSIKKESSKGCGECMIYRSKIEELLKKLEAMKEQMEEQSQETNIEVKDAETTKNTPILPSTDNTTDKIYKTVTNSILPSTDNMADKIYKTVTKKSIVVSLRDIACKENEVNETMNVSSIDDEVPVVLSEKNIDTEKVEYIGDTMVCQELIVEKTELKTFEDTSTQINDCCQKPEKSFIEKAIEDVDTGVLKDRSDTFSDTVDSEISFIADKLFSFVKLAGKLTRKQTTPPDIACVDNNIFDNNRLDDQTIHEDTEARGYQPHEESSSRYSRTRSRKRNLRDYSKDKANISSKKDSVGQETYAPGEDIDHLKPVNDCSLSTPHTTNALSQNTINNAENDKFIQPYRSYPGESIERSWTESGFFDDSRISSCLGDSMSRKFWQKSGPLQSGWLKIKHGKINHVLRFLGRIAKSKCSYLYHEVEYVNKEARTPEEAVMHELSAFVKHAIDLMDVISFALKRIESDTAEEELENKLFSQLNSEKGKHVRDCLQISLVTSREFK